MGVDLREDPIWPRKNGQEDEKTGRNSRYISIYWKCCSAYSRIYPNREGSAYEGNCPKCCGFLRLPIGEGGTNQRMFFAE
jgi:hypothetical protein